MKNQSPQPHAAPPKKIATKQTPAWATTTPEPTEEYMLGMYSYCAGVQVIDLSREEFIWLKSRLAKRCGFLQEVEA